MSEQPKVYVRRSRISAQQHCRAVVTYLAIATSFFGDSVATLAQERQLTQSAVRQIDALHADKMARTPAQRKLGSRLLFEARTRRGDAVLRDLPKPRSRVAVAQDGTVLVDIRATVSEGLLRRIEELGGTVVNHHERYDAIRAYLPVRHLETLAESQGVRIVRSASRARTRKINTSEGDVAHQADSARATFGVDGSGVRACVLSDSVDELTNLQASGDLPAVTVLPGQSGIPDTSEGTATLEILHDLAPGVGGKAQMAQNILALQTAGCDVIADNIGYFDEAVFQDDIIAQAVDTVAAAGTLFISAAGNGGNLSAGTAGVWEGDYVGMTPPPPPLGTSGYTSVNNFGPGNDSNAITVDPPVFITLQWNDPLGGSNNDYDLFLFDSTMTTIEEFSDEIQDGTQDPFEFIVSDDFDDTGNLLVVARFSGIDRFLHLNSLGGQLLFATDGQIFDHAAATGALAVAAVDVATAGGGAFTGGPTNPVETYSSDGPRRIFFDADGTPNSIVRLKPDIAAADGVATATPGFNPFFGTSASAPHAAGIAALLKQRAPSLSVWGARALFPVLWMRTRH
jgi:hypothetical protein